MFLELQEALKKKKVVDVDLNPEEIEVYSGVGLLYNKEVFIMINYNEDVGNFDGYTILHGNEIQEYRLWDKQDLKDFEDYNIKDFDYKLPLEKMQTFYACLEVLKEKPLIALFTRNEQNHFFVGKIVQLTKKEVTLKLIDTGGNWAEEQVVYVKDIAYLGFDTSYEKALLDKM